MGKRKKSKNRKNYLDITEIPDIIESIRSGE